MPKKTRIPSHGGKNPHFNTFSEQIRKIAAREGWGLAHARILEAELADRPLLTERRAIEEMLSSLGKKAEEFSVFPEKTLKSLSIETILRLNVMPAGFLNSLAGLPVKKIEALARFNPHQLDSLPILSKTHLQKLSVGRLGELSNRFTMRQLHILSKFSSEALEKLSIDKLNNLACLHSDKADELKSVSFDILNALKEEQINEINGISLEVVTDYLVCLKFKNKKA
ncbi:MAG: hypothetical protein ABIA76_03330 [Candidatus Diapherotrites archaeon]